MGKAFSGKAIYNPSGKAGEYSKWACNFFTGCSNDCSYCYCKKGFLGRNWSKEPQLKKCFKDIEDAFKVFCSELRRNLDELREHGIFFTFTSDPMLPEAKPLTVRCIHEALNNGVPVQILTKRAEFIEDIESWGVHDPERRKMVAFGFTLTCHDELEPGASRNRERIMAMFKLHQMGYRTFASIEPIIEPSSSMAAINLTSSCCDLFKVGLMSGKRNYNKLELKFLIDMMREQHQSFGCKFYLKESYVSFLKIDRSTLGEGFVGSDYNIFEGGER